MMKIDFDPCTRRWSVCLPEEPGRPRIEADSIELLEQFLHDVSTGQWAREKKLSALQAAG